MSRLVVVYSIFLVYSLSSGNSIFSISFSSYTLLFSGWYLLAISSVILVILPVSVFTNTHFEVAIAHSSFWLLYISKSRYVMAFAISLPHVFMWIFCPYFGLFITFSFHPANIHTTCVFFISFAPYPAASEWYAPMFSNISSIALFFI